MRFNPLCKILFIILVLFSLIFPAFTTSGAEEKPWINFGSEHFRFFVEKGSQADLDREKIIDFYESTLADLENRFQHKLSPSDLITVKLYPEYSEEVLHTPQFSLKTIGNQPTIIDVYNEKKPTGSS